MPIKSKDDLVTNLISSIKLVSQAEDEIYNFVNRLKEVEDTILDIEHFVENNEITNAGAVRIIKLLKQLRMERRQIKETWEVYNTYGIHREKLKQKDNREFLFNELHKTERSLETTYRYRILEESYLQTLNEGKTRGKYKKKDKSYNNNEEENIL